MVVQKNIPAGRMACGDIRVDRLSGLPGLDLQVVKEVTDFKGCGFRGI